MHAANSSRVVPRALLFSVGVWGLLMAGGPRNKDPIPNDLKIIAQYYAGYSPWKSWRYTITRDAKVAQEIFDAGDTRKESKLTEDDLRDLLAKIEEAKFFSLKERYDYPVTDNPTLVLKITRDKKSHEVAVYAPHHLEKEQEVRRFFKVWAEVLRKVPAPNADQKPGLYKP
jgi:hypothetical protein